MADELKLGSYADAAHSSSDANTGNDDAAQGGQSFAEEGAILDDDMNQNPPSSSAGATGPNSNSNSAADKTRPSASGESESVSSNLIGSAHIRPIFLGNLDMGVTAEDISDLFTRPALNLPPMSVERVDLKRGFAFVFMHDAQSQSDKERIEDYVDGIQGMYVPTPSFCIHIHIHTLVLRRECELLVSCTCTCTSSAPAA
mmetsp:Transcript_26527/g.39294  ORF Transcript_26527/g.39294 Transcript_26527/m.39294 type:complete len:200 (-) Transcript_26527:1269-1868(-)